MNHYIYKPEEHQKRRDGSPVTVIGWRIYYGDGSTFDSKAGLWKDAPDQNVQVVMLWESGFASNGNPYRHMMDGCDYYFSDGKWWGKSFDDKSVAFGDVKYGKFIFAETYEAIQQKALKDKIL